MRKILFVLAMIGLLSGGIACGKGGGDGNPVAPTPIGGTASLAVNLKGQVGEQVSPIAGLVKLAKESYQLIATQEVAAGQPAQFQNLDNGVFRTWGESFGYSHAETAVQVSGNVATEVVLPAVFAVRLLEVTANGQRVNSGDTVEYPTDLAFKVEAMNPTTDPWLVSVTPNLYLPPRAEDRTINRHEYSQALSQGLQVVVIIHTGFQPCTYVAGQYSTDAGHYSSECVSLSNRLRLNFTIFRAVMAPRQVDMDFVINYRAK